MGLGSGEEVILASDETTKYVRLWNFGAEREKPRLRDSGKLIEGTIKGSSFPTESPVYFELFFFSEKCEYIFLNQVRR